MVTKGIFQETLAKIILILSGFVLNILLARKLGPAEYGVVGIVSSILFVFELFLTNGIRQGVSKIISSQNVNIKALWKKSFIVQMILCLILITIGLISLNWIVIWLKIEPYKEYLFLIFLIIPVEGIYYINQGFLNGLLRYRQHAIANSLYSLTRVVFSLLFLYVLNNGVLAVLLGTLIAYTASLFFARIDWPEEKATEQVSTRFLLTTTFGTLIFFLLVNILLNLDVLLLRGFGMSKILVGYYKASASIGIALYFLFASVIQVSYPLLSRLYSQNLITDLKKVVNTLFLAFFYSTSLAFVFTYIFSRTIIGLLFGNEYVSAADVLPWYVLSISLLSLVILLGNMMIAFDHKKTYLIFLSSTLVLYVILVFLMITKQGLFAPPYALIIVTTIIIGVLIYLLNQKNQDLVEVKKLIRNISWLTIMVVVSIFADLYLSNITNQYLIGTLVFVVYFLVSIFTSNEVRSSMINSISILLRGKK